MPTKDKTERILSQYCIVGHHTGLPDGGTSLDTKNESTLQGRLKRTFEAVDDYQEELEFKESEDSLTTVLIDQAKTKEEIIERFAFLTKLNFSALVDADTIDTINAIGETSYDTKNYRNANLTQALNTVNQLLNDMPQQTLIQKARQNLQHQAITNLCQNPTQKLYLLNMPTGSGKTLTSLKIALELAKKENKRIVYIIPFNGIIDQTYQIFEQLIGKDIDILRHQSTYQYEDETKKRQTENWDAPFIVTTMVQFFESLVSNKRGKCRKLHNLKNSIIVFDEAHLLPENYLQPCLQGIWYCCKYLNAQCLLMSATLPDYPKWSQDLLEDDVSFTNLITDTTDFGMFDKCTFDVINSDIDWLTDHVITQENALIIVNRKKTCRTIYHQLKAKGINVYHLSTYQTSKDRIRIISKIKNDLSQNKKIYVVSTSLIEAGIDVDFKTVYRELSGLEHILQSAGRCNREGKYDKNDCKTYIVKLDEKIKNKELAISEKYVEKITDKCEMNELIKAYYDEVYTKERMNQMKLTEFIKNQELPLEPASIPFKSYSEAFKLINDYNQTIIVPDNNQLLWALKNNKVSTRSVQDHACTVSLSEVEFLLKNKSIETNDSGITYLIDEAMYDENIGIKLNIEKDFGALIF